MHPSTFALMGKQPTRWMTNGVVVRRVNGSRDEALVKSLGFKPCDPPQQDRPPKRTRYQGR